DDLELGAVDHALQHELVVVLEAASHRAFDLFELFDEGQTFAPATPTGLEDAGPAEQLDRAHLDVPAAAERDGSRDGEVVVGQKLPGADLVVGEAGRRGPGAGIGQPSQLAKLLDLAGGHSTGRGHD